MNFDRWRYEFKKRLQGGMQLHGSLVRKYDHFEIIIFQFKPIMTLLNWGCDEQPLVTNTSSKSPCSHNPYSYE